MIDKINRDYMSICHSCHVKWRYAVCVQITPCVADYSAFIRFRLYRLRAADEEEKQHHIVPIINGILNGMKRRAPMGK